MADLHEWLSAAASRPAHDSVERVLSLAELRRGG